MKTLFQVALFYLIQFGPKQSIFQIWSDLLKNDSNKSFWTQINLRPKKAKSPFFSLNQNPAVDDDSKTWFMR